MKSRLNVIMFSFIINILIKNFVTTEYRGVSVVSHKTYWIIPIYIVIEI